MSPSHTACTSAQLSDCSWRQSSQAMHMAKISAYVIAAVESLLASLSGELAWPELGTDACF